MHLKHYSAQRLKEEILGIVGKFPDLKTYRVFFFGSRIKGGGSELSDIDIGIEGEKEIPYEILGFIKDEIQNLPTLYTIDIVDFKKVSDDFRKTALQNVEEIT